MSKENSQINVVGHVKIVDDAGNVVLDKHNAVHNENLSNIIALALAGESAGHIFEMHFGVGGSSVSSSGSIVFLPPNVEDSDSDLYKPRYYKIIDKSSSLNSDPSLNKSTVTHVVGNSYTDIVINCTLDYGEPSGQPVTDSQEDTASNFQFDEIGLKNYDLESGKGKLLSHIVFVPIYKALNRRYDITYTLRINVF